MISNNVNILKEWRIDISNVIILDILTEIRKNFRG